MEERKHVKEREERSATAKSKRGGAAGGQQPSTEGKMLQKPVELRPTSSKKSPQGSSTNVASKGKKK